MVAGGVVGTGVVVAWHTSFTHTLPAAQVLGTHTPPEQTWHVGQAFPEQTPFVQMTTEHCPPRAGAGVAGGVGTGAETHFPPWHVWPAPHDDTHALSRHSSQAPHDSKLSQTPLIHTRAPQPATGAGGAGGAGGAVPEHLPSLPQTWGWGQPPPHTPVAGLHVLHAEQATGVPLQEPSALQVSCCVHLLPSSQVPERTTTCSTTPDVSAIQPRCLSLFL